MPFLAYNLNIFDNMEFNIRDIEVEDSDVGPDYGANLLIDFDP